MNPATLHHRISEHVDVLKSMANHKRLGILCAIYAGEKTVSEIHEMISDKVEISQSSLSQHLGRMREEGIVRARREARNIFYSLNGDTVKRIISCLHDMCEDVTKKGE